MELIKVTSLSFYYFFFFFYALRVGTCPDIFLTFVQQHGGQVTSFESPPAVSLVDDSHKNFSPNP